MASRVTSIRCRSVSPSPRSATPFPPIIGADPLKKTNELLTQEVALLRARVVSLEVKLETVKEEAQEESAKCKAANELIKLPIKQVVSLDQELVTAKEEAQEESAECKVANELIKSLRKQVVSLELELETAKEEAQEESAKCKAANELIKSLGKQVVSLGLELETAKEEAQEESAKCKAAKELIKSLRKQVVSLELELEKAKEEAQEESAKCKAANELIKSLRKQVVSQELELEMAREEAQGESSKFKAANELIKSVREQLATTKLPHGDGGGVQVGRITLSENVNNRGEGQECFRSSNVPAHSNSTNSIAPSSPRLSASSPPDDLISPTASMFGVSPTYHDLPPICKSADKLPPATWDVPSLGTFPLPPSESSQRQQFFEKQQNPISGGNYSSTGSDSSYDGLVGHTQSLSLNSSTPIKLDNLEDELFKALIDFARAKSSSSSKPNRSF